MTPMILLASVRRPFSQAPKKASEASGLFEQSATFRSCSRRTMPCAANLLTPNPWFLSLAFDHEESRSIWICLYMSMSLCQCTGVRGGDDTSSRISDALASLVKLLWRRITCQTLDRDVMLPALVGVSLLTATLPNPDVSSCFPKSACQCAAKRLGLEAPGLSVSSGPASSGLCKLIQSPFAGHGSGTVPQV